MFESGRRHTTMDLYIQVHANNATPKHVPLSIAVAGQAERDRKLKETVGTNLRGKTTAKTNKQTKNNK